MHGARPAPDRPRRDRVRGRELDAAGTACASDLPARSDEVFGARIERLLQPRARRLAQLQALALFDEFTRADYAALDPTASGAEVDAALDELLAHEVVRGDGLRYRLSHAAVRAALLAGIGRGGGAALHRALAELHERGDRPGIGAVGAPALGWARSTGAWTCMLQLIAEAEEPERLWSSGRACRSRRSRCSSSARSMPPSASRAGRASASS